MKVTPSAAFSPNRLLFHFSGQQFQAPWTPDDKGGSPKNSLKAHSTSSMRSEIKVSPSPQHPQYLFKSLFWVAPHLAEMGEKHSWPPPSASSLPTNSNPRFFLKAHSTLLFYRLLEIRTTAVWPPLSNTFSDLLKYICQPFNILPLSLHNTLQCVDFPQVRKHTQRLFQDHSTCNWWNLYFNLRCLTSKPVPFALCLKMFWLTNYTSIRSLFFLILKIKYRTHPQWAA